jgi:hypothetical protein
MKKDIPTALKRISHFDAKALNSTVRTQIIYLYKTTLGLQMVLKSFMEVVAFSQWNAPNSVLVQEAAVK